MQSSWSEYKVIRRNGAVVGFEPAKISVAMTKAYLAVNGSQGAASARIRERVAQLTGLVVGALQRRQPQGGTFHIEDIQDQVELALMRSGEHDAMGATPVSILPPIMLALGYSSFVAIALPALGYDALCTYALLGVPVVVFTGLVNLPVNEVGGYFARFMPVISTCIAIGMLWMVGKWRMVWKGLIPALLSGLTAGLIAIGMNRIQLVPLTGVAAGLGVMLVMLA